MARRILLADDSVTAQNMGRRILHDAGYEIITVNNGSAALKKVAEQKPDLIILDVYMPGYGGLEVCSRLKENRETQRIPVLLTVGKLEPFKPEEARRVRADAYIVKPFEASELLAALTKLEDKIVPGPDPHKPGRFAKALASVEGSDEDFGDKETGWKDRLIIPGKKGKKSQPEPEPEVKAAKSPQLVERGADFRPAEPKSAFERPIPGGLPQDISAEEIAAIAAAAAKISKNSTEGCEAAAAPEAGKSDTKQEAATQEAVSVAPVEPAAHVEDSSSTPASELVAEDVPPATFASAPESEAASTKTAEIFEPVTPEVSAQSPEPNGPALPDTSTAPEEKRPVSDAEVLAALAALTPANGDFSSHTAPQHDVVSAEASASISGPRWIAEAVAATEEESSFLLEHEMEKAHAAFAAADAGRATLLLSAETAVKDDAGSTEPSPEAIAVAEPELKSEEPKGSSVETAAQESPVAAVATVALAAESALAAAASAGGASETAITEAQAVASTQPSGTEEGTGMREAELAAAWANWRNIREAIIGPQTSDVPEPSSESDETPTQATAPPAEETTTEAPTPEEPEAAPPKIRSEASPAEDPAELASIVDNMLAELKPKLMEELKRKLRK